MDQKDDREEMTRVALEKADSVIDNLKKAWETRPLDLSDEDEKRLIQAMDAAKRLRDEIILKFGTGGI